MPLQPLVTTAMGRNISIFDFMILWRSNKSIWVVQWVSLRAPSVALQYTQNGEHKNLGARQRSNDMRYMWRSFVVCVCSVLVDEGRRGCQLELDVPSLSVRYRCHIQPTPAQPYVEPPDTSKAKIVERTNSYVIINSTLNAPSRVGLNSKVKLPLFVNISFLPCKPISMKIKMLPATMEGGSAISKSDILTKCRV